MLSANNITIQFGERFLFRDVSFTIGAHDRIGLVGSNGAGKSTLLKTLGNIVQPDSGSINKARYVTVGYLPQEGIASSGRTLYREAETAFEDVLQVQQEIEEAHRRLEELDPATSEYMDTLEVFGELQHKLEDLDAFRMKSKIEQVLIGLGFSKEDFHRQTDEFSGGWQMRIEMAKLLLREPSVLLLDEPTNHLDIESLQWLEEKLSGYNGAVVLVSHDRAFLDNLTKRTWALSLGRLDEYAGNYAFYEKEKEVRRQQQLNAHKSQQQQIKQTQKFVERFRYKATKARQVQSRIKQLEKMELIEIEDDEDKIHFHFPKPRPSGHVVMEIRNICKSYGEKHIFKGLNYTVERGDRIAVVGVNGAGKSTFVRLLAGVEPVDSGEITAGYNVIPSYFAQHQAEELDLSSDVLGVVDSVATGEVRTKLRTILGAFLFHGDDVFKKVSVLSGGEKSRLALAKMLLQPANFLIMDEPTNHLDMRSKKVLQDALKEFEGTYVIVSHDRAFLDPLVNKVAEFSHGKVRTFAGDVSDYLYRKKEETESTSIGASDAEGEKRNTELSSKERRRLEAEKRDELSRKLRPLKSELKKAEEEISRMESRRKEIEAMMADPEFYRNGEETKNVSIEYKELKSKLEDKYFRWGELTEEIEKIME
ncbi:MAG: ABC-F family ATP-binding cassette domain-containing protein [Bacteroidetes bacterium]|nr:ABC-F family ATP-binding cassette domain-containing protein [Bacteroidota bacterium]MCL5737686.1 ABC-F family ATP-binding cassette domain-containing protein [Bacteroidota bacterium]